MPTQPLQNGAGNEAGKQENNQPFHPESPVINTVKKDDFETAPQVSQEGSPSDDFGRSYLLGRQVAHEYHSPAVQRLLQSDIDPQQFQATLKDPEGATKKNEASDKKKAWERQESIEGVGEKDYNTEPWIDPVSAFAGGFGGVGALSLKQGLKLIPSLGRALTSGVVGAVADYPIGVATEGVEKVAPGAALPFNVVAGFVSGATLENAIEKGLIKLSAASGEAAAALSRNVYKELVSGEPTTKWGVQLKEQFDMAFEPLMNQRGSIEFGEYRGVHTAPTDGFGSPGHDLTDTYPDDIYSNKGAQYYGHYGQNDKNDVRSISIIKQMRGNPDLKITIYRAIPNDLGESAVINPGDWVTINKEYAKQHGESALDGNYKIVSKTVTAKDIFTDGNSIHEWGYDPQTNPFIKVAKDILSSEQGAVMLEGAKKAQVPTKTLKSGVPELGQKLGDASKVISGDMANIDIDRKYAGNINLTKIIQTPDDIQKIIAGTADQFSSELQTARRGKVSWDQTEKDASKYSLEDLLGRKVGTAYNDAQVENARTLLVSSSENLKALRDKITTKTATDADKADFLNAFNMHYAIEMQVAGAAAEAGRALRAFGKIAQSNTLKTREINEVLQQGMGKFNADQLADMMAGLDTLHQVNTFVDQATRATTMDMVLEAWINGLLSGPQTHVVNTLSNTLTALWQIPERAMAAGISRALGTEGGVKLGEARVQAWGFVQGAKDGFKTAAKVLRTGEPMDAMDKIEARKFRAITAENVGKLPAIQKIAPDAFQNGGIIANGIDLLGEGIRLPGRFLGAEDDFFKSIGYRMELNARAYRDAVDQGLEGQAMADHIQKVLSNPSEMAPDIHAAAIDASRYQTFTKELGETGKSFQMAVNGLPVVKFIIPFMRTPTNIMKFAGERTPVAFLSKNVRAELAAGGARRDLALAKMGMGTMAMTSIGVFASQGMITGGGPSDPKEMATWRAAGWQPYSIKVGDKYVSYGRLEPVGMLFGLAADFVAISGLADENLQPEIDELAGAILASISKNVTSKTWLSGVSDAIEAFDDPDRYMGKYLQRFVASGVPAIAAQTERTMNPELEAIYSYMDAIKARIPGLSANMPKRRNVWGDEISTAVNKDRSWGEVVTSAFNPFYVSRDKATPIDNELIRLGAPISKPRRLNSFDGVAYEMSAKEYDQFIVNMNEVRLMTTGKNLKDSLNDLVTRDPEYKRAIDDDRVTMIRRVFNDAKREARRMTREQNPIMNQVIETIRREEMMARSR